MRRNRQCYFKSIKIEIKNINSFRFVERAINFEVERQIDILENGGKVVQETRLYDADKNETRPMRSKEEANDYRYFPDPDLLPVVIQEDFLTQIKSNLPELPDDKKAKVIGDFIQKAKTAARAEMVLQLTEGLRGDELRAVLAALRNINAVRSFAELEAITSVTVKSWKVPSVSAPSPPYNVSPPNPP